MVAKIIALAHLRFLGSSTRCPCAMEHKSSALPLSFDVDNRLLNNTAAVVVFLSNNLQICILHDFIVIIFVKDAYLSCSLTNHVPSH
jgi:hypothetical protein